LQWLALTAHPLLSDERDALIRRLSRITASIFEIQKDILTNFDQDVFTNIAIEQAKLSLGMALCSRTANL